MVLAKRKLKVVAVRNRKERAANEVAAEHDDIREAIERAAARRSPAHPPTFEEDVHAIWLMSKGAAQMEAARKGALKTNAPDEKEKRAQERKETDKELFDLVAALYWKYEYLGDSDSTYDAICDELRGRKLRVGRRRLDTIMAKMKKELPLRIPRRYGDPFPAKP